MDAPLFVPNLFSPEMESIFDLWMTFRISVSVKKTDNKADRPANSRERWAGALMEVRSLFGLNSTA